MTTNSGPTKDFERLQKEMHDNIAEEYSSHATEEFYEKYKERFMLSPLTEGLDLANRRVLEAMCGSGQATHHLLSLGAKVTGLDISTEMIRLYNQRWPGCETRVGSIYKTDFPDASFDCVFVVAGLHHLHPSLLAAIDEIHRVLKPGGHFCFVEPHVGSFANFFRNLWYKFDKLIVKNEAAVDIQLIQSKNSSRFDFLSTRYWGNIAYLFVANSLFFRIPIRLKRFYSPVLIAVETALGRLGLFRTRPLTCFVTCQWRKKK
jgi:SAM-dependent methyltransferase